MVIWWKARISQSWFLLYWFFFLYRMRARHPGDVKVNFNEWFGHQEFFDYLDGYNPSKCQICEMCQKTEDSWRQFKISVYRSRQRLNIICHQWWLSLRLAWICELLMRYTLRKKLHWGNTWCLICQTPYYTCYTGVNSSFIRSSWTCVISSHCRKAIRFSGNKTTVHYDSNW